MPRRTLTPTKKPGMLFGSEFENSGWGLDSGMGIVFGEIMILGRKRGGNREKFPNGIVHIFENGTKLHFEIFMHLSSLEKFSLGWMVLFHLLSRS